MGLNRFTIGSFLPLLAIWLLSSTLSENMSEERTGLRTVGKFPYKRSLDYRRMHHSLQIDAYLKILDPELREQTLDYHRAKPSPELVRQGIQAYNKPLATYKKLHPAMKRCVARVERELAQTFKLPEKIERLGWGDIGEHMRTPTAAGYPLFGLKNDKIPEILDDARNTSHWAKIRTDAWKQWHPCVAAYRTHMSKRDKEKLRLIWVTPAGVSAVEGGWAVPLLEQYLNGQYPIAASGEFSLRLQNARIRKNGKIVHDVDYKGWDQTVPAWVIRRIFKFLFTQINWDTWDGKQLSDKEKQKWINLWDNMVEYFVNTPILFEDILYRKLQGIPSGSWWTVLVNSLCNFFISLLALYFICWDITLIELMIDVLGDDINFVFPYALDLDLFSDVLLKNFGMIVNVAKSLIGEAKDSNFLGFTIRHGLIYRSEVEWAAAAVYPEGMDDTPSYVYARLVGLNVVAQGGSMILSKLLELHCSTHGFPVEFRMDRKLEKMASIFYGGYDKDFFRKASRWRWHDFIRFS